jgi:hypothetical protein
MSQFVAERVARFARCEVPPLFAPPYDRVHHATDQLPHRGLAFRRVDLPVKIFRRDDVRRRLRPRLWYLDVFLLENHLPAVVPDLRRPPFPFHRIERRHFAVRKTPRKLEPRHPLRLLLNWHRIIECDSCFRHLCLRAGSPAAEMLAG